MDNPSIANHQDNENENNNMSNIQSSPLPLPPRSSVSSLVTNISASSNTNRAITNSHRESVIAEANAVFKRGTTTGRSPINSKLTTSRRTNRKTHVTFKDFVRLEPRRYRKNRERKMRLIYTFKKAEKTQHVTWKPSRTFRLDMTASDFNSCTGDNRPLTELRP
jgi:hypothetical protein